MPEARRYRNGVNVLLIAEEAAGVQTLRAILKSRHRITGVVTSANTRSQRGATVHEVAQAAACPIWAPAAVNDPEFIGRLRDGAVDVLLNVHSLRVVHPAIVEAPAIGSFNLHPGPLPEYAGLNAPSWAIFNGEPRHAVTVHWMESEIDAGPVAFREELPAREDDTGLTLSAKCVRAGVPLLLKLLDLAHGDPAAIPRLPQDPARRRYHGREVPDNGRLRWSQPAARIVRLVRACDYSPLPSPWGHPRTRFNGEPCAIVKAFRTGHRCHARAGTVGAVENELAHVAAADEWVAVGRIHISGRAVPAAEVLTAGACLED